jgi:DNA-directed RNA polymerase subunit RPC12/RpoP
VQRDGGIAVADEEISTFLEDLPTCPYCGWREQDYYDVKDGDVLECGKCGKEFVVEEVRTDISFTTKKKEEGV